MRTRALGATGTDVAVVGQGTWMLEESDGARAQRSLFAGLDAGATHVDTAEYYGDGRVETLLGEMLGPRRDEVFLASKVVPDRADRAGTIAACERSLRRLRTEGLDLYLLHWIGPHPFEETFAGFEDLRSQGKIRAWGVSNFDEHALARAVALAGPGRIACNQVLYHLKERAIEHAVLPACRELGVALVGYSPFGQDDFPAPGGPGAQVLAEVADARGATPRQVALAFLTRDEATFTIPKAARPEHARDNAGAGDLVLTESEIERIDAAFPRGPRTASLPML